jgi:hypothetical protein
MVRERPEVPLASELLKQSGRPLDVREEEGNRAAGELSHDESRDEAYDRMGWMTKVAS